MITSGTVLTQLTFYLISSSINSFIFSLKHHGFKKKYRKNSKIWDTSNNFHNCPKNRKVLSNIALMHPKDADGMAHSVDPDQTASSEAVGSWSALFAETYLSQYIEFVRYRIFPAIRQGFRPSRMTSNN